MACRCPGYGQHQKMAWRQIIQKHTQQTLRFKRNVDSSHARASDGDVSTEVASRTKGTVTHTHTHTHTQHRHTHTHTLIVGDRMPKTSKILQSQRLEKLQSLRCNGKIALNEQHYNIQTHILKDSTFPTSAEASGLTACRCRPGCLSTVPTGHGTWRNPADLLETISHYYNKLKSCSAFLTLPEG